MEETGHETRFDGSPRARGGRRRLARRFAAGDRTALSRPPAIPYPLAPPPPSHRLPGPSTAWGRTSPGWGGNGPRTTEPLGARATRRHARGVASASRGSWQEHGDRACSAQAEPQPPNEGVAGPRTGPSQGPSPTPSLPQEAGHPRSRATGLRGREGSHHDPDAAVRPRPQRRARFWGGARPVAVGHPERRAAVVRGGGVVGVRGGQGPGGVPNLGPEQAGAAGAAGGRGALGQAQAASGCRRAAGGGAGGRPVGVVTTVQPGSHTDREEVVEGQGTSPGGGGTGDRGVR